MSAKQKQGPPSPEPWGAALTPNPPREYSTVRQSLTSAGGPRVPAAPEAAATKGTCRPSLRNDHLRARCRGRPRDRQLARPARLLTATVTHTHLPTGVSEPAGRGRALSQLLPEPARRKGGPGAPLLLPWGKAEVRPGQQEAPPPPPRSRCTPSHRDAARGCGENSVLPWVREANRTVEGSRAWSVLCLARTLPRIPLDQVQARPSRTGRDTLLCRVSRPPHPALGPTGQAHSRCSTVHSCTGRQALRARWSGHRLRPGSGAQNCRGRWCGHRDQRAGGTHGPGGQETPRAPENRTAPDRTPQGAGGPGSPPRISTNKCRLPQALLAAR